MHAESTRIVAWTGAKTVFQITVLQFARNSYSQFQWHKSTIPETKVRDKSMKEPICCQFPHSRFKFRKKNRQLFLGTIVDFFSQMTPRPPLRYRGPWPLHPQKKKAIVYPMSSAWISQQHSNGFHFPKRSTLRTPTWNGNNHFICDIRYHSMYVKYHTKCLFTFHLINIILGETAKSFLLSLLIIYHLN